MNKIDRDACSHYHSMVDYGDKRDDKEIEKDASWRALHDQTPKRSREDAQKERDRLTDKRKAAKAYVKGYNPKNESRYMNKKLTKLRETNGNRHPSQNDLPPIDKFHPDWWYYRQEMEEPVEIDNNYNNESRYMNSKLIRLTESDLHRIVKESVKKILREGAGNEYRGVLLPYGYDVKIWGPKIDIYLDKKGWSTDKIQRAIDWDAHQGMEDYQHKW